MYCHNCGNKLEKNAAVCVKCGVFVNEENKTINKHNKKRNNNYAGLASIIFGVISFCLTIKVMISGIGNVDMMIVEDRIIYGVNLIANPFILAFIGFLIAIVSKNRDKTSNIIGLSLSLLSMFFLLTEIVMVLVI